MTSKRFSLELRHWFALASVCALAGITFYLVKMRSPHPGITPRVGSAVAAKVNISQAVNPNPDFNFPNPNPSATDDELLTLARTAVARSPSQAIGWARSQTDPILSRRLLFAVTRAWGERDPVAALDWVTVQDTGERQTDLDAALAGAVTQPRLTLTIVRQLLSLPAGDESAANGSADPWRTSLSASFVVALNNSRNFPIALEFLKNSPPDSAADWTAATFRCWAQSQPQDALSALATISDSQLRQTAFRALADGWSASDPATLAACAATLPAGDDRDYAVNHAFNNWSQQDPAGLAAWLNTHSSGTEFDQGAALMMAKADSANYSPQTALQWVESIGDPALKLNSFAHLLNQWNQTDPAAAQQSVVKASWLDESQRSVILKNLQSPPPAGRSDD